MAREYHKIPNVFNRERGGSKKVIEGAWTSETTEMLMDVNWVWTEKVDGTNIRIHWDGHRVEILGRTEKAQIPKHLMEKLEVMFLGEDNEEIFEEKFGEKDVYIFGEGYGTKIQKGGNYLDHADFVCFDIMIDGVFLEIANALEICNDMSIAHVPIVGYGTLVEAVEYIKGKPKSMVAVENPDYEMEGIVCTPVCGLLDRFGNRIIVKIKCRDF